MLLVVSHREKKRFPTAALARARQLGAMTAAIVGQGAPEPEADAVIRTCPDETSGTHTVSYVTALGALIARLVPIRIT
jgi:glucosamine--fructose-6-phosphate aminotransferase (isomerizing)